MPKRPFQRFRGILRDEYEEMPGRRVVREIPVEIAGEGLEADERSAGVTELASRNLASQFTSALALGSDRSPDVRSALLSALRSGSPAAPIPLVAFIHDGEVREALLDAARRATPEHLANFAQAVVSVGGADAIDLLEERLRELVQDPRTFEDDPFFNWSAGSASTVAGGLLKLRPTAHEALAALVQLLDHPCAANRESAASQATAVIPNVRDDVRRPLLEALRRAAEGGSLRLFAIAAPVLVQDDADRVFQRLETLLADRSFDMREIAAVALMKTEHPRALETLARHLQHESSTRLACAMVLHLGQRAPTSSSFEIARRSLSSESPSLRLDAASLLSFLASDQAAELAVEALVDEPDPAIRSRLQVYTRGGLPDQGQQVM